MAEDEDQEDYYMVAEDNVSIQSYDPFDEGTADDGTTDDASLTSASLGESHHQEDTPHWVFDAEYQDWVKWRGGKLLLYRKYQKPSLGQDPGERQDTAMSGTAESFAVAGSSRHASGRGRSSPGHRARGGGSVASVGDRDLGGLLRRSPTTPPRRSLVEGEEHEDQQRARPARPMPRQPPRKKYLGALDPKFNIVEKPKRFFSIGRIFKTVWFEPGGQDGGGGGGGGGALSLEYANDALPFYGERPFAKFRWFVVVRKRLHHSLCLSITTFGRRGATKGSRGRPKDFVVLYSAGAVEPPEPFPEEGIERDPVAVIIEDGGQFIAPVARLDCGRVYTVEDNLKVMKLGRVHPDHLERLEEYYKEAVR